jgi:hypothetical protein
LKAAVPPESVKTEGTTTKVIGDEIVCTFNPITIEVNQYSCEVRFATEYAEKDKDGKIIATYAGAAIPVSAWEDEAYDITP